MITWSTKDHYLVSFLHAMGFRWIELYRDGKQTRFVFQDSLKIRDAREIWKDWTMGNYAKSYKTVKHFKKEVEV